MVEVQVLSEFLDVFLKNVPASSQEREVEFAINFALGTAPISKTPYYMVTTNLNELKKQIVEQLEKQINEAVHRLPRIKQDDSEK